MKRLRVHFQFIPLLTVLVAVLMGAVRVDAQSVLNFPRVLSSDAVFTGVAIGNPTSGEATVTLTAYGADGTLAEGGENPTTVTIAAGGQLARQHRELFGDGDFNGWVQATSGTAGLTGFFLNANPALTDLDGALAGESGGELILPFIAGMAPSLTEVTVVNPGQETATVTLEVFGVDGVSLGTATLELEAKALVRQLATTVFEGADIGEASHIRVTADREVVAYEVVAYFELPGVAQRRETIALAGRAASASTAHVLAQYAVGGGWLSYFGVVNTSGTSQIVTVRGHDDDGSEPEATVTLGANAAYRGDLGELLGIAEGSAIRTGWIEVEAPVGYVASYIGYGNTVTPSFALVAGAPEEDAAELQVYSQVAEGAGFFTGVALVNPETRRRRWSSTRYGRTGRRSERRS